MPLPSETFMAKPPSSLVNSFIALETFPGSASPIQIARSRREA